VRGPKHVIKRGKTPVLTTDQARVLIESIDTSTLVGLRDRALIGVMTYAFARIGAVVAMWVEDYFANGKRWWVRLHEKGGKRHEMPAHHKLEAFLDEYLRAASLGDEPKSPLFRSARGRTGELTGEAMHRIDAWRMIQRRAAELGMKVKIGCHTFRATGITAYLEAGGTLENAQAMAAQWSRERTTSWCPIATPRTSSRPSGAPPRPKPDPASINPLCPRLPRAGARDSHKVEYGTASQAGPQACVGIGLGWGQGR
jgi:integrase/recombinase XerD